MSQSHRHLFSTISVFLLCGILVNAAPKQDPIDEIENRINRFDEKQDSIGYTLNTLSHDLELERELNERLYHQMDSEFSRYLVYISILVVLFGLAVPIIINVISNRQIDKRVSEVDSHVSSLRQDFSEYKKLTLIDALFDKAIGEEDNEVAIQFLSKILELDPHNERALLKRGFRLRRIKKYEESILDYRKVLSLNPNNAKAYNSLGLIYAAVGNDFEAKTNYLDAVRLSPKYSSAYYNLAGSLYRLKEFEDAKRYIDLAINVDDSKIAYYRRRIQIMKKLGGTGSKKLIEDDTKIIEKLQNHDLFEN